MFSIILLHSLAPNNRPARHYSRHLANLAHVKLKFRAKHVIKWTPTLLVSVAMATLPRVIVYVLGLLYFRFVLGLPHRRGKSLECEMPYSRTSPSQKPPFSKLPLSYFNIIKGVRACSDSPWAISVLLRFRQAHIDSLPLEAP